MAFTVEQQQLVGEIMGDELTRRLAVNQAATVAMLFDPATPNAARNFLRNRLNAMKTQAQADRAALATKLAESDAALASQITLIDSILAQL